MPRPDLTRVPESFHNYIKQVRHESLKEAFEIESREFIQFLVGIPENKRDFKYGPDKWTIKEVLQHLIDAERVFSYRALRFARKDMTPLPSFDENLFAATAKADKRHWDDLIEEFKVLRRATEYLFNSFDAEQLESAGISSGNSMYVLAVGFAIIGHCNHHEKILKERYLGI